MLFMDKMLLVFFYTFFVYNSRLVKLFFTKDKLGAFWISHVDYHDFYII